MKPILTVCFVLLAPTSVFAGCATYEDNLENAPKILACYGDACDVTVLVYECANVYSYQAGYQIGWTVQCDLADKSCEYAWQDREIDPAKHHLISFTPIDD